MLRKTFTKITTLDEGRLITLLEYAEGEIGVPFAF